MIRGQRPANAVGDASGKDQQQDETGDDEAEQLQHEGSRVARRVVVDFVNTLVHNAGAHNRKSSLTYAGWAQNLQRVAASGISDRHSAQVLVVTGTTTGFFTLERT